METRNLMQATINRLPIKLKEQCENCLFNDVIGHGKKSEELLWTRVYHEPMQVYKRLKGSATTQDIVALQLHLVSGIGFYYGLLRKISSEYSIDFGPALGDLNQQLKFSESPKLERKRNVTSSERDAIRLVTHGIFIHIGDLFRYLDNLAYPESKSLAIKWYDVAILFEPKIGMPYNQLGTLSSSYNYGFDSAYYYMRCLMSEKPFDGAEGNLRRILMSAPRFLADEMAKTKDVTDDDGAQTVKKCIIQLLVVANEIFNHSSGKSEMEVANAIQDFLTTLTVVLNLPTRARTPHKPTYLDPSLLFEMGTMSLMFITYLRANGVTSGIYYSASVALSLNFLLLNVNAFLLRFKDKITNLNVTQKPIETVTTNGTVSVSGSGPSSSKENSPEFSPRRTLSRLRRRKAAITYENIDSYLLDYDEDDSELSELEETALSTIDALEISSDISETGSVCDEESLKSSDDEDSQTAHSNLNEPEVTLKSNTNIEEILRYLYYETSLPTIKTLCDWLRVDQKLVAFSAESIAGLFSQFAEMLNILKDLEIKALASNHKLERFKYTDPSWTQKYPLTSDMNLLKFKLLDKFHSLSINVNKYYENLDAEEMGFLALECIISFGHFLTNNMNKSQLSYDVATRSFKYAEVNEIDKWPLSSKPKKNCGIFWDIENVAVPKKCGADEIVSSIRSTLIHPNGLEERDFYCVCNVHQIPPIVGKSLESIGVTIVQPFFERPKNAADTKILKLILKFIKHWGTNGCTIVVVTGDSDFIEPFIKLKLNYDLTIMLIHGRSSYSKELLWCVDKSYQLEGAILRETSPNTSLRSIVR